MPERYFHVLRCGAEPRKVNVIPLDSPPNAPVGVLQQGSECYIHPDQHQKRPYLHGRRPCDPYVVLVALDVAEGTKEADVTASARAQADRQFVTVFGYPSSRVPGRRRGV